MPTTMVSDKRGVSVVQVVSWQVLLSRSICYQVSLMRLPEYLQEPQELRVWVPMIGLMGLQKQ